MARVVVTLEMVELALNYLRDTAEEHAQLKGRKEAAQYKLRRVEALKIMESKQSSGVARQAEARASKAYGDAVEELANAVADYTVVEDLREAAQLKLDIWRSLNANNRMGLME